MKAKRQKQYKKCMQIYQNTFGFREPYQVIVDGNFCQAALDSRTNLKEQLPKTLLGQAKPMYTLCGLAEIRAKGEEFLGTVIALKRYEKRRCPHKTPLTSAECLAEIIGEDNPHNYCVATQDIKLRSKFRKIAGVPLLYLNRSVMILEPPSGKTLETVAKLEKAKTLPSAAEIAFLKQANPTVKTKEPPKPRKKKPKAPNPLSCKKKKEVPTSKKETDTASKDTSTSVEINENGKRKLDDTENTNSVDNEPATLAPTAEEDLPKKKPRKRKKKNKGENPTLESEVSASVTND
ncbi:hypothetical protein K7432_013596 [Basidiobolus ranarum]|uniref:UTP23 sensor motif region domain-containing protein n=1 Tax=Basidiobolus ranarum TaxID=34480 RepID=A0ABR2WIZ5_9FUNG